MSTLSVDETPDDPDPSLGGIPRRCADADAAHVWRLARAWHGSRDRGELVNAALGLATELGRRREVRAAMARVSGELRASPGGRDISRHLRGIDVLFRAQAAAGDAALAVLLRDQLSAEIRDALAAPWSAVFGTPFSTAAEPVSDLTRR